MRARRCRARKMLNKITLFIRPHAEKGVYVDSIWDKGIWTAKLRHLLGLLNGPKRSYLFRCSRWWSSVTFGNVLLLWYNFLIHNCLSVWSPCFGSIFEQTAAVERSFLKLWVGGRALNSVSLFCDPGAEHGLADVIFNRSCLVFNNGIKVEASRC